MKIKKLQIYGFKTFVQPTEVIFHDGVTSVVGPNGCGKSNIIDALRWVMGEKSAKGLRGDSMEDVIFSGSASRKPLNFAEVTLTLGEVEGLLPEKFGNYHEISVTRRLHRSGDSEYLINKVTCRLKDITDLFLDTGLGKRAYSIVEQGRIDAILSAKPVDRRFLIEEAAGLSKYRARRDETQAKMKQTAENLDRLNDIIGEVRREMTSLKRQAGRAKAFKELRGERRVIDRDLLLTAWGELSARLAAAKTEEEKAREALLLARANSDKLGNLLEQDRLTLLTEEKTIEDAQRKVYGLKHQVSERENRITFLDREADSLLLRAARAEQESKELQGRVGGIEQEVLALKEEMEALGLSVEERTAAAEGAEDDHRLSVEERRQAESRLEAHRKASFHTMTELSRVNNALEHNLRLEREAARKLESYDRQQAELSDKLSEVEAEVNQKKADHSMAERALDEAAAEKQSLEEDAEDLAFERQTLSRRVEETRKTLHTAQSRLKGLTDIKAGLECYGDGVKAIMKHARDEKWVGLRGVVADTVTVPQKYETALEAALGERLQYVVVADPEQAVESVTVLRSLGAGRGSFVPVDLHERPETKFPVVNEAWAHGPLMNLVKVEPGGEKVARTLLGGFYVVETLEEALALWNRRDSDATFVTLTGDTVTPEGVVTGGSASASGGLLKRNREIAELQAEVSELTAKLSLLEDELAEIANRHEETTRRLNFLREEAHRHELRLAHASRDMAQFSERKERLAERLEAVSFERDDVTSETLRLAEAATKLEAERVSLIRESEAADEVRLKLEEEVRQAAMKADSLQASLNRLKIEIATDRQRREGLHQQVKTLERNREGTADRAGRMLSEAAALLKEQKERVSEKEKLRIEAEVLTNELSRVSVGLDALMQSLDEKRAAVSQKDKDALAARRAADELTARVGAAELNLRETEIELRTLSERFSERLETTIEEEAEKGVSEGFDPVSAKARAAELDEKIRAFGEVNLLADVEYEEKKERFDFLEKQRLDLDESLESLKSAISRINRICRERFDETFHAVNGKFKELYPTLFKGGEAELFLTDPENLLETGIDIIARPPGKRPQHLSLLSGGEKALTAVALIFSLFLVKPSPFCVLDEVDAPLDDANVERFTELLVEMSGTSQFLVITHNKITMEAAAHLYGVTMEEAGISNLVSVRLMDAVASVEVA